MILYKHNKKAYNELCERFKTSNKIAIVQATGTGKSYIAYKYIQKHKDIKNILILVPTTVLASEWEKLTKNLPKQITVKTYQHLLTLSDDELEDFVFDKHFIVLDELHRCGASIWGKQIKKIFDYTKHNKILGLTATPVRTLDNFRDMSKELFKDNIIHGVDIASGISLKILPKFKYVAALFQGEDQIKESMDKVEKSNISKESKDDLTEKLDKLLLDYRSVYNIKNIVDKHIDGHKNFIIFCNSIKEAEELDPIIETWFDDPKILSIDHNDSKSKVQKILKEFENSTDGITILKSINMLNEGLHLQNIDGLIMLRKTESEIIFLQQLGRALTANSVGKDIIIFDFVGNHCNLRGRKNIASVISNLNNNIADPNLQIIIDDKCIEILNLLETINNAATNIWTKEEDDILIKYYPIEKRKSFSRLPHRTDYACDKRASILELTDKTIPWSKKEDDILRKYYPIEKTKCFSRLTNRTEEACRSRVSNLGITRKKQWTEEDDALLIKYYPIEGSKCFSRFSNRTEVACRSRAKSLEITKKTTRWSKEEDSLLIKYYPIEGKKCFSRFPNRTEQACIGRIKTLKLNNNKVVKWTKEEDAVLRKYYPIEGKKCFSRILNRTEEACAKRISVLGITNKVVKWSKEEDDILIKYYLTEGTECFSRLPHRTKNSCNKRVQKLKLTLVTSWTEEEDDILRKYYPIEGKKCFSRIPTRTKDACRGRVSVLNLTML